MAELPCRGIGDVNRQAGSCCQRLLVKLIIAVQTPKASY
jgi:hypothetical protein